MFDARFVILNSMLFFLEKKQQDIVLGSAIINLLGTKGTQNILVFFVIKNLLDTNLKKENIAAEIASKKKIILNGVRKRLDVLEK